jgi:oligopeptide transport system permease protein
MADGKGIVKGTSLWADAWKRLLKNKLAVFGLIVLALMVIAVIIGPSIIKWTTGFTADYIPSEGDLIKSFPPSWQHPMGTDEAGRDLLARVLQGGRISLMVGIISTIVSLIIGVSYGAIAAYLGGKIDNVMMRIVDIIYSIPYILIVIVLLSVFGGPNTAVLIEWMPQILSSVILLVILVPLAVVLYRRLTESLEGKTDGVLILLAKFPYIVLSVAVMFAIMYGVGYLLYAANVGQYWAKQYAGSVNQSLSQIFLLFFALGLVSWLTMARVVRGQVLSLKNQEFVLAARATGVSTFGIIFRHLVPNTLGPVIVYATLTVPSVMLTEAFLSFLGLGVQAPYASWGSLAADGIKNIAIYPWQMIFPGVTMALTLFSLNFVGDGLRDALDPQTRKF